MGRKTWESIGRPLPGRRSIVVTRDAAYAATGAEVVTSLDAALARCTEAAEIFVIGGAELYRLALPRADRLLITEIDHDFEGDTTFPEPDRSQWHESAREHHAPSAERPFGVDYVEYIRR
jgi:dihydrofolate reductase